MAVESECPDGLARHRRVMAGAGMFICVRDVKWGSDRFKKGKTRIAPEWFRSAKQLELLRYFAPCDGSTRDTYQRMIRQRQKSKPGRGTLPGGMLPARGMAGGGERWRL
jgi:hypothetical protein